MKAKRTEGGGKDQGGKKERKKGGGMGFLGRGGGGGGGRNVGRSPGSRRSAQGYILTYSRLKRDQKF